MIRCLSCSLLSTLASLALLLSLPAAASAQEEETAPAKPKPKVAAPAKPAAPTVAKPTAAKPGVPKPTDTKPAVPKPADAKAAAKPAPAGAKPAKPGTKPATTAAATTAGPAGAMKLADFGDWGAYTSNTPKGKVCYALAQPKERLPKTLKRDPGYVFISNRPTEGVRNEVSFQLGFPTKDGGEGSATIGATSFALVTKGDAAWVKNAAEDAAFVEALRKGQSLVIQAQSKKGNESTDRFALTGVAQALELVRKECP